MADNRITLVPDATFVGNLTKDPDLRFTQGGKAIATLRIAVNRNTRTNDGQWREEEPAYFDVVCWDQLGENVAASLTKGSRIVVKGRLEQRSYTTNNGEQRTVLEIAANEVGPSLRYATASLERTDRRSGDAPSPAGAAAPASRPASGGYSDDEEPF